LEQVEKDKRKYLMWDKIFIFLFIIMSIWCSIMAYICKDKFSIFMFSFMLGLLVLGTYQIVKEWLHERRIYNGAIKKIKEKMEDLKNDGFNRSGTEFTGRERNGLSGRASDTGSDTTESETLDPRVH